MHRQAVDESVQRHRLRVEIEVRADHLVLVEDRQHRAAERAQAVVGLTRRSREPRMGHRLGHHRDVHVHLDAPVVVERQDLRQHDLGPAQRIADPVVAS